MNAYYQTEEFEKRKYMLRFPSGYNSSKKYPVLIFLHGAGTRDCNANELNTHPFFTGIEKHTEFPFITLMPLCNEDSWFDMFEWLVRFTKHIAAKEFADANKIYGMGSSMGGYGLWQLAMTCNDIFAAIVPICGGGMYWNAARLKNIDVWAFHGGLDDVVFSEESKKMVDAINQCGGNAKLTIYPENMHNAWTDTFENYEVFKWLLDKDKKIVTKGEQKLTGSKTFG